MMRRCVALLGRRDSPTDALEEYCTYLAGALHERGIDLELARVAWEENGWSVALRALESRVAKGKNVWFLLQYTALAWSRRGFSWRVLNVLRLLKNHGARCGIVFHDVEPYSGSRLIDRIRRQTQLFTMRKVLRLAELAIFTVPPGKIPWVAGSPHKAIFIPIGANLPAPENAWRLRGSSPSTVPTVAIFSLSPGRVGAQETELIARAALQVTQQVDALRIVIIGRNSGVAQSMLQQTLHGKPIEVIVHGILPAAQVVKELGACDAMLFVRGPISSRRGSAIAGIACGLPVIAREGWETADPITQAGVVLVPPDATDEFGPALLRVLTDKAYRDALAERSRRAQAEHFSWDAIAAKYAEALGQVNSAS